MNVTLGLMIIKAIANKIIFDYTQIFKFARNTNRNLPNIGLPKPILEIDNFDLICYRDYLIKPNKGHPNDLDSSTRSKEATEV